MCLNQSGDLNGNFNAFQTEIIIKWFQHCSSITTHGKYRNNLKQVCKVCKKQLRNWATIVLIMDFLSHFIDWLLANVWCFLHLAVIETPAVSLLTLKSDLLAFAPQVDAQCQPSRWLTDLVTRPAPSRAPCAQRWVLDGVLAKKCIHEWSNPVFSIRSAADLLSCVVFSVKLFE